MARDAITLKLRFTVYNYPPGLASVTNLGRYANRISNSTPIELVRIHGYPPARIEKAARKRPFSCISSATYPLTKSPQ